MTDQPARDAVVRAADALTFSRSSGVRQGEMCVFGSRHPNGPCKACQRAEARRAVA